MQQITWNSHHATCASDGEIDLDEFAAAIDVHPYLMRIAERALMREADLVNRVKRGIGRSFRQALPISPC